MSKKLPFAEKLSHWCKTNDILDCAFYDTETDTRYAWESDFSDPHWLENGRDCRVTHGRPFSDAFGYYREFRECNSEYVNRHIIGMSTEGDLNHAIHYGDNETLYNKFKKFIEANGYFLYPLGNCYNLIISNKDKTMQKEYKTIEELIADNHLEKGDYKKHFVTGGVEVYYPYIGEDGKPHLGKAKFMKEK